MQQQHGMPVETKQQQDVQSPHTATMLSGLAAQPAAHLSRKTGSSASATATCPQTGCASTSAPAQAHLRAKQGTGGVDTVGNGQQWQPAGLAAHSAVPQTHVTHC